jgi:signal transduction histidine kinase
MLDDYGLLPALDWYARQFAARTGIEVNAGGDERERPSSEVEIALFRIAQEALNNVAKHARAKSVDITLERADGEWVLRVVDDGIGFAAAQSRAGASRGFGLVTMRERAQAVGGRFEARPLPAGGTELRVRIPVAGIGQEGRKT